jgi:hypothetical protein
VIEVFVVIVIAWFILSFEGFFGWMGSFGVSGSVLYTFSFCFRGLF